MAARRPFHQTTITHLPDHLVADILSRLPTKTIFASRFVCKLWNYLTSKDSHFPKLHFSKSHFELLLQFKHESTLAIVNWVDPEFDTIQGFGKEVILKPRTQLPYTNCGLISTCRGFVFCLHKERYTDLGIVCNPLTGEYILLPRCKKGVEEDEDNEGYVIDHFNYYGFGYSSSTNHFKVLRIFSNMMNPSWMDLGRAHIHVLGSDSWQSIVDAPFCPSVTSLPILLNEVLHWLCDVNKTPRFMVYFDFQTERFGEFGPPFGIAKDYQKRKYRMTLGLLDGCLSVCDMLRKGKFDVWVMKQYGVRESWSKYFVVDTTVVDMFRQGRHQPIKMLDTGEILMFSLGNSQTYPKLVCYDPEDNTVRMLKLLCFSRFELLVHTPSFISLKDVVMGDNLNVLNIRHGLSTNGSWKSEASIWIGTWKGWPTPFLMEHCFASVDDYRKLPD